MDPQHIENLIFEAIDETNRALPEEKKLLKQPETMLYGMGSSLDSIDLVTFIVTCEQKIEDELNRRITLANDKALSMKHGPFQTVGTLTQYCCELLSQEPAHV